MFISSKYRKKALYYQHLAKNFCENLNYSQENLENCYLWESQGKQISFENNGYAIGKRLLNLNINMWKEDIQKGLLNIFELEADSTIPKWILKGKEN